MAWLGGRQGDYGCGLREDDGVALGWGRGLGGRRRGRGVGADPHTLMGLAQRDREGMALKAIGEIRGRKALEGKGPSLWVVRVLPVGKVLALSWEVGIWQRPTQRIQDGPSCPADRSRRVTTELLEGDKGGCG